MYKNGKVLSRSLLKVSTSLSSILKRFPVSTLTAQRGSVDEGKFPHVQQFVNILILNLTCPHDWLNVNVNFLHKEQFLITNKFEKGGFHFFCFFFVCLFGFI